MNKKYELKGSFPKAYFTEYGHTMFNEEVLTRLKQREFINQELNWAIGFIRGKGLSNEWFTYLDSKDKDARKRGTLDED